MTQVLGSIRRRFRSSEVLPTLPLAIQRGAAVPSAHDQFLDVHPHIRASDKHTLREFWRAV